MSSVNTKTKPADDLSMAELIKRSGDRAADVKPAEQQAADLIGDLEKAGDQIVAEMEAELPKGATRIVQERQRQITAEGYDAERDDQYATGALTLAALTYSRHAVEQMRRGTLSAILELSLRDWPWHVGEWKPADDPLRNLEKAGALIAAEIDRLLRMRGEA